MTTDSDPGEEDRTARGVGRFLLAARRAAGLSQMAVVAETSLSQSRISRIERGEALPETTDDGGADHVGELSRALRLDPAASRWLDDTVRGLHRERSEKRIVVVRGTHIGNIQRRFRRAEADVSRMRSFSAGAILGHVQSPGYVAAMFGADDPELVAERLRRGVDQDHNLHRRYEIVLAEAVATWPIGSLEVMADQLDHLVAVSGLPHVDLRWLPATTVTGLLPGPGFTVYDGHTVVLTQVDGYAELKDRDDLDRYVERFEALQAVALRGEDARGALRVLARSLRDASGSG